VRARQVLAELFAGGTRAAHGTVLVVDEVDMLLSHDQSVLYNLFSWMHSAAARFALIGIANTLDLPLRLQPKVARCVPAAHGRALPMRSHPVR
jgi:origin recognition complex subunit 1